VEFAQLTQDERVVGKLRILVGREHHPLYGTSKGYLTDAYMTHDAVFGHVYMCSSLKKPEPGEGWIPSSEEVIKRISTRYRQWRALRSV